MRICRAGPLLLLAVQMSWAQGWLATPARHEMLVPPGKSSTFVVRLEREAIRGVAPEPVRFTVAPGDWDISRSGEVILAPPQSLPESANAWMIFSPAEFTLPPGGVQQVRVTISVPQEMPPGVYRAGLFFEEHSPLPPQQGVPRRVVIRYRMSTLIYVMVPPLQKKIAVHDVEVKGSTEGGLSVRAVLQNLGTVHLRPQHWVELRDGEGKLLLRTDSLPTMVVLPGRELEVELHLPKELPRVSSYQIRYLVDAGRDLPLQSTTLSVVGRE